MYTPLTILVTQEAAADRGRRWHRTAEDSRRWRTPIAPELIRIGELARLVGRQPAAVLDAPDVDAPVRHRNRGAERVA